MQITKAVITAAGRGARQYPASDTVQKAMLPLVDRDGLTKPVLQIIAEEAMESGIEEIGVVTAPGRRGLSIAGISATMPRTSGRPSGGSTGPRSRPGGWSSSKARLRFAVQPEPEGYGHAVWCAREFVGGEPFLLLLGDHLYISSESRRCARQLIDLADRRGVRGLGRAGDPRAPDPPVRDPDGQAAATTAPTSTSIDEIIEKPNPTLAELRLQVPGLRAGHYLCFFGMHVLTPDGLRPARRPGPGATSARRGRSS